MVGAGTMHGLLRYARNDGSGARNDGSGARNDGSGARNDGSGAGNNGMKKNLVKNPGQTLRPPGLYLVRLRWKAGCDVDLHNFKAINDFFD